VRPPFLSTHSAEQNMIVLELRASAVNGDVACSVSGQLKMRDLKTQHQSVGVENAGPNATER